MVESSQPQNKSRSTEGRVVVEYRSAPPSSGSPASPEPPLEPVETTEVDRAAASEPGGNLPPGDAPPEGASVDQVAVERDQLRDRLLRTAAEFDNYRKRVDRERRDQHDRAAADLLAALLSIVDDLERALSVDAPPEAETYRKGVELIHRQLAELLVKRGVTPIEAIGADFDPRFHEAVVHEDSPDHRPGEVIGEFRRGYMLGDKLLRASMVKVARS